MALVTYPDSDSDTNVKSDTEEAASSHLVKRPRLENATANIAKHSPARLSSLPPLPSNFHDLYASTTRVSLSDVPSLHGGRKRVIPHVEGNWPTHIYLEWNPSRTEYALLGSLLEQYQEHLKRDDSALEVKSLLRSDLGALLPLHVSLSKPVVLTTDEKSAFADIFEDAIQKEHFAAIRIIPGRLDWVSNHEDTRWFLVLRLQKSEDNSLNRLLHISNQSLAIFDQPPLYANIPAMNIIDKSVQYVPRPRSGYRHGRASKGPRPSKNDLQDYSDCFHISLAWSLSRPSKTDNKILQTLEVTQLKDIKTTFESVKVKIGNHVSNIVFSSTLD